MTEGSLRDTEISIEAELDQVQDAGYLLIRDEELSDSPIFVLDPASRIAFVLHHILGHKIEEASLQAGMSENKFRAHLGRAYRQLVSSELGREVHFGEAPAEPALAS